MVKVSSQCRPQLSRFALLALSSGYRESRVAIARLRRAYSLVAQPRYRPSIAYFLGSGAVSVMWAWDWQLVLATGAGMGCLALICGTPPGQWQRWRSRIAVLSGKLPLAVGLAGTASLGTYLMAAIWAESENRWLAIASIGQGLVSAAALALVVWQVTIARQQRGRDCYEQWLRELTAGEPIRRLMAVRQLSERAACQELNPNQFQQLIEYFTLILIQETEESVRQAIFESLQIWQVQVKADREVQPIQLPMRERLSLSRPIIAD